MMRRMYVVRGIALFFVLFTFADLGFPQVFCPEEFGALVSEASHPSSSSNVVAVMRACDPSSGDMLPGNDTSHEEDCFCCCGHVLPTSFAFNNSLRVTISARTSDKHNPPTVASHSGIYRPPRIA